MIKQTVYGKGDTKMKENHTIDVPFLYDWVRSASRLHMNVRLHTKRKPLKAETFYYYALADGKKTIYTDADQIKEFTNKGILDPKDVSYIRLFINGVLQPPNIYEVKKGMLRLKSSDVPQKGVPIILEFISIYL